MRWISSYLTGKAADFYMKHISERTKKWKLNELFDVLFEYCFPPDYKTMLRKRLKNSYQGRKTF